MGPRPLVVGDKETRRNTARSLVALTIVTAIRLIVAAAMPLSPDEAYYWVWSRALAPGYLDHPPMIALWIRAGTTLLGDTPLGVRLLAPLAAAAGSFLLAGAANQLFPGRRPGVWAAILLNATIMCGAGAITMTPDTPLLFFWTAALYALSRLSRGGSPLWWLAVGAAAGLGLDSKYTAALLGLGIALWLLTPHVRPALRTPWPWAGGAVALVLTAPVIEWNAMHQWASLLKQGGRAGDWHPALRYLGELLAGQLGLATPVVAVIMVIGTVRAVQFWRDPAAGLLAALILPGAVVFLQHAIGDRVQANWVAILYPAAAIAAAAYAPAWRIPAAGIGFALTAVLYLQASLAPLPLPRVLDPTLRLTGFGALATAAAQAARDDHDASLASEEYGLAALLAWHGRMPVAGIEPRWRFFDLPPATATPMLLVLSGRRSKGPNLDLWQSATPIGTVDRRHNGVAAEPYRLYRVVPRAGAPAVTLPQRAG